MRGQRCFDVFLQNLLLQPSRALFGSLCRIPPMWKACGVRYPLPVLHLPHYSTELDTVRLWLQLEAFLRGACRSVRPSGKTCCCSLHGPSLAPCVASLPCGKPVAFDILCQCCISRTIQLSWIQCIFGINWKLFCVEHVDLSDQFTAKRVCGRTCSAVFLQNLLLQPSRALFGSLCRIPPMWKALAFDILCQCCISRTIQLSWIQCIFWLRLEAFLRGACRSVRPSCKTCCWQPSRALPGSLCRIPPMWKACGIRCPLPVLHLPHYSTELDTVHFWLQLEAFLRGACRSVRPVYSKKSAWANMFCDFKKSNTFGLYIGLNSTRTWVA